MTHLSATTQPQSCSYFRPGVVLCLLSATAIALVLGSVFVASSAGELPSGMFLAGILFGVSKRGTEYGR